MAKAEQVDRVEITRMANGYMVCRAHDFNRGDQPSLNERYVYNDFKDAAAKAQVMLGEVEPL